jgi:hypothetical protein
MLGLWTKNLTGFFRYAQDKSGKKIKNYEEHIIKVGVKNKSLVC